MSDITQKDMGFFEFGDFVRNIQNPHLTGQVVGEMDWGDRYQVRLADGASTITWHWIEFELDPDMQPPVKAESQDLPDNVIPVDFTKARELRNETKTEGAA